MMTWFQISWMILTIVQSTALGLLGLYVIVQVITRLIK